LYASCFEGTRGAGSQTGALLAGRHVFPEAFQW
jgi:hypothetical protein